MRPTLPPTAAPSCLVEIIELKWLLRGHGIDVHVERLQSDPEYARQTLAAAALLPHAPLRAAAARLHGLLLGPPPEAAPGSGYAARP